jgi:glycosyltransferase involved in cell wall biosynthesis
MWSIVHVLTSYGVGGGERVALDLAIGQQARGHRVSVISLAPEPDGAMAAEFAAAGIHVGRVGKHAGIDYLLVAKLVRMFRERRADVVHTHNPLPLIYGVPAARLAGAAAVHTKHGANTGSRGQAFLRRAAAHLAQAFVAVSETTAEQALAQHDVAPGKLHTIPNGIRLERYAQSLEDRADARAAARVELGLGDAAVIGTVGRLDPPKNQVMLVRALAPVLSSQLRLVIIGEGTCRPEIEAEIAKLPEPRWVVLAGRRMDVPRLMPAFDVFALSSSTEGLPLVVLEAMAAGLPVASTNVGGIPAVVEHGVTGLLTPVEPVALGAAIGELVADPARAKAMGERGRALALGKYSSERMVDAYLALYARFARG